MSTGKELKFEDNVLVIAPSRKTRGGITSVVRLYEQHEFWYDFGCYWLETHIDKGFRLKSWYFLKSWISFFFLIHDYRIVHIHFSEPPSAFRKLFFMFPARLLGRKIILHFHSFSPETTINGKYSVLYKWMFNHADAVVVLSNYWKERVASIMHTQKRLFVIHNPARYTNHSTNRSSTILFAGTLCKRKGYNILIEAFFHICRWHKDWTLVMAGNGEIDAGRKLAKDLNIADRVFFEGWVDGIEKDRLFRSASIFCLPSYAEGFPMAVIDAMSYEIPVISTPVGGLLDIFSENEDLLMTQPGAILELAMKIDMLILSPDIGKKLAKSAKNKLKKHFDINLIAAKLTGLYDQLSSEFKQA